MTVLTFPACWKYDTHERPTFPEILKLLDEVAHSKFHQMPDDNFYMLQDDWKLEIDEMLIEIREKEKVSKAFIWLERLCLHEGLFNPISTFYARRSITL